MRTVVVTGSASGMGAATKARLEADGQRVIGVDLRDADVIADLGTASGRAAAIAAVEEQSGGVIDGLVTWAGIAGLTGVPGSLLVSINYFGTVALQEGLRPLLASGERSAGVGIRASATPCGPGIRMGPVEACLDGGEDAARADGDAAGSLAVSPATKIAVAC